MPAGAAPDAPEGASCREFRLCFWETEKPEQKATLQALGEELKSAAEET
jgi:hypothetical protein